MRQASARLRDELPLPPGRRGLPGLGETVAWVRDPLRFAQERAARYGPVWQTHLLGKPTAVLLGPDANRLILGTARDNFSSRDGWGDTLYNLVGEGLSLQDGERHRQRRLTLQPAFHQAALAHYFERMVALSEQHVAAWMAQPSLALFDGFKALTFAIAAEVLLGDVGELATLEHHFNTWNAGLFSPLMWDVRWTPFGQAVRARRTLDGLLRAIIARRRTAAPRLDALGALLAATDEAGAPLGEDEIVAQLLLLLWAGHDTVTSLLTWIVYELDRHPAIAAELRAELLAVAPAGLAPEHLRQLPALDRVLREAERLHPPAAGGFRGVRAPFAWGGYRIPAGWNVMYSIVHTHHDPALFADPARFDPARFAAPRSEGRHAFSMIGFGAGPRVCLGLAMAQMEMRIIVATLLRHAAVAVLPDQDLTAVATPTKRPKDRLLVTVTGV